ncbi:retrotransposon protein, putative, ty1-copia subclass [Tanacetum coccineum]
MVRKPFSHQVERAKDLLGLIHTDVCGPIRTMSREGASYFITFTYDFSHYGYVYLMKHKHEVFETFKVFQNEVKNQLGKKIEAIRSDRGGEYLSYEFVNHMKSYGYPKETMSYYFYYPLENKIFVARNAEFFENSLMIQEASGSHGLLESNLGEAAYIIGIKIIRDRSTWLISLSQSAYLEKILKRFWMENFKKGYTPMIENPDYRKSQGAKTPSEHLRNTKDMVLVYGAKPEAELKVSCYVDASFQIDKDDTKSQTGYVFVLNGGVVDWKSAKQSTTAMSSAEVEYIAAAKASMEAI